MKSKKSVLEKREFMGAAVYLARCLKCSQKFQKRLLATLKKLELTRKEYVVHIPTSWPGQYPVKSRRHRLLGKACDEVRRQYKKRNSKHPNEEQFGKNMSVFLLINPSTILLLTNKEVQGILKKEGNTKYADREFIGNGSIYDPRSMRGMPNAWFAHPGN